MEKFINYIKQDGKEGLLDKSVYSQNRCFRTIHCTKFNLDKNEDRFLRRSNYNQISKTCDESLFFVSNIIPELNEANNKITDDKGVEKAPNIIILEDNEKFKDNEGNIGVPEIALYPKTIRKLEEIITPISTLKGDGLEYINQHQKEFNFKLIDTFKHKNFKVDEFKAYLDSPSARAIDPQTGPLLDKEISWVTAKDCSECEQ
jgi:hypothetical protein